MPWQTVHEELPLEIQVLGCTDCSKLRLYFPGAIETYSGPPRLARSGRVQPRPVRETLSSGVLPIRRHPAAEVGVPVPQRKADGIFRTPQAARFEPHAPAGNGGTERFR